MDADGVRRMGEEFGRALADAFVRASETSASFREVLRELFDDLSRISGDEFHRAFTPPPENPENHGA